LFLSEKVYLFVHMDNLGIIKLNFKDFINWIQIIFLQKQKYKAIEWNILLKILIKDCLQQKIHVLKLKEKRNKNNKWKGKCWQILMDKRFLHLIFT